jgi:hypothetical protein
MMMYGQRPRDLYRRNSVGYARDVTQSFCRLGIWSHVSLIQPDDELTATVGLQIEACK